jgi:cupin 2 domain-containing protein
MNPVIPDNIFAALPDDLGQETFTELLRRSGLTIERIVSKGHVSPPGYWYDQDTHEWVMVLKGAGTVAFADDREVTLRKGDYLNIPAHARHRVTWTDPDQTTVWLAIHYS